MNLDKIPHKLSLDSYKIEKANKNNDNINFLYKDVEEIRL